jgi:hypothetical protein
MVRPLIAFYLIVESWVVVIPTTDVDYKKIIEMVLVKVGGYIFNVVTIGLFDEVWSWEGHSDDSISDICEIEIFSLVSGCYFGSCNNFPYKTEHFMSV